MIHTPTPPTPLCIESDISEHLVDKGLEHDPRRLYTVMKRPDIMRIFLESGGKRIVAYPKEREFGFKSTDSKHFSRK